MTARGGAFESAAIRCRAAESAARSSGSFARSHSLANQSAPLWAPRIAATIAARVGPKLLHTRLRPSYLCAERGASTTVSITRVSSAVSGSMFLSLASTCPSANTSNALAVDP